MAIIRDQEELEATVLDGDRDGGGCSVKGVLDQLLDGGGGALDDFSCSDPVYHRRF
jgi:hypothetical protein